MQNEKKNGKNFIVFFRNNWELRNKCVFQNAIEKENKEYYLVLGIRTKELCVKKK